jgi:hypothetical protein
LHDSASLGCRTGQSILGSLALRDERLGPQLCCWMVVVAPCWALPAHLALQLTVRLCSTVSVSSWMFFYRGNWSLVDPEDEVAPRLLAFSLLPFTYPLRRSRLPGVPKTPCPVKAA